jgi:hypothetical protein
MRRDAAHGVEGDGAADHLLVPLSAEIGPGLVEGDLLLEGHAGEFGGDGADARGGDAAALGHGLGRVVGER